MTTGTARRRLPRWMAAVAVFAVLTGMLSSGYLVWFASEAAFRGTTTNPTNTWTAAQISMTDDDGGATLFSATALRPGSTGQKCIKVTYDGTITSGEVRIYSAAPSGTLAPHINLTVEVGTVGTFATCGAFAPASTPINNVPLSTVGTKTGYITGYPTSWSPPAGDFRVFRFTYTVSTSIPDSMQGAACALPFTWETQA
jgi:hypothetical protein